jgi:hypothetical protein
MVKSNTKQNSVAKVAAKASKDSIGIRVSKRYELEECGGYVNACLRRGKASGNVRFKSIVLNSKKNGINFLCTSDCIGGRGLRVDEDVGKHEVIAKGYGKIVPNAIAKDLDAFKVYDSKDTTLVLDVPTKEYPANLANTSNGVLPNNCKLLHKTGTDYISIQTLRPLKAGEEVIVAYGSKYTKAIREYNREEESLRTGLAKIPLSKMLPCVLCKREAPKRLMYYDYKIKGFRHKMIFPCVNLSKKLNEAIMKVTL